jgi:hypothetical protein
MTSQTEAPAVEVKLSPSEIALVDDWRAHQSDHPSRAEAIRRLVSVSLAGPMEGGEGPFPL